MKKETIILYVILIVSFSFLRCAKQQETAQTITISQSSDPIKKFPTFLTYGGPRITIADSITEKYGFKIKSVTGCIVSDSLTSAVHQNNENIRKEMNEKYGKHWVENFEHKTNVKLVIPFN